MFKLCFIFVMVISFRAYDCWPWPWSRKIRYLLFDRSTQGYVEMSSNGDVPEGLWNSEGETKLLVHGYNSYIFAPTREVLRKQFQLILASEYAAYDDDMNIIVVDWTKLSTAALPNYPVACANIKPTARDVTKFLLNLMKAKVIPDLDSVHILGLSLGAHMAGETGHEIQKVAGGQKIGRITGFDPAGPLFSTITGGWPADMSVVLDYSDATFVDIIHTNAGRPPFAPLFSGSLGTNLATGHIDFYPNGGSFQTDQCSMLDDRIGSCSHQMSVLFYALALRRPHDFIGCPCDSYEEFMAGSCPCSNPGEGVPIGDLTYPGTQGRYYLTITEPLSEEDFEN